MGLFLGDVSLSKLEKLDKPCITAERKYANIINYK